MFGVINDLSVMSGEVFGRYQKEVILSSFFWYDAGRNMVEIKIQRDQLELSVIKELYRPRPRYWGCMPSYIGD